MSPRIRHARETRPSWAIWRESEHNKPGKCRKSGNNCPRILPPRVQKSFCKYRYRKFGPLGSFQGLFLRLVPIKLSDPFVRQYNSVSAYSELPARQVVWTANCRGEDIEEQNFNNASLHSVEHFGLVPFIIQDNRKQSKIRLLFVQKL